MAVARRVVDDLVEFSDETVVPKYMHFFIAQQIANTRSFINRMRDEAQSVRNCIGLLNALIAEMNMLGGLKNENYESEN
ncbi:hypothetical protein Tco_1369112 [Tanacetum coccineum]